MALSDVLRSFGRFIGLYSDDNPEYGDQGYQDYPPQDGQYDIPVQDDPIYQSGYGTGASYVHAGATIPQGSGRRHDDEPPQNQGLFGKGRQHKQTSQPDNVIPFRDRGDEYYEPQAQQPGAGYGRTIIFCVRRKDDSSQIIDYLLSGVNVILNFEEIDDAQCQRVLDLVSGAAFALRGTVERISHRNYLVAPTGVEIVRSETQSRPPREGTYGARY